MGIFTSTEGDAEGDAAVPGLLKGLKVEEDLVCVYIYTCKHIYIYTYIHVYCVSVYTCIY